MAHAERRWRDRSSLALLGAGGLLVVAAAAALVLGLTGAGGDDDPPAGRAAPAGKLLDSARFGIRLRHPDSWRRRPGGRAIRLVSGDRRVGLTITTAAARPAVAEVRPQLERSVLRTLDGARVIDRGAGRVGGRPARLTAIRARNERREVVDALAITVASRYRTYAIVAFGSPAAAQAVLREARAVLDSVRFRRPGRR
ncbi:MAG TPA: hypothetical protein VD931_08560 [Baekduia sp.]|nr:hypothetical protein [Baekduia sp.]